MEDLVHVSTDVIVLPSGRQLPNGLALGQEGWDVLMHHVDHVTAAVPARDDDIDDDFILPVLLHTLPSKLWGKWGMRYRSDAHVQKKQEQKFFFLRRHVCGPERQRKAVVQRGDFLVISFDIQNI